MAANHHPSVIIVRKKKARHGAHHGGAWKVAYADFVTAMMAFFLVMWLVGQSEEVKHAVAGYFTNPGLFEFEKGRSPIAGGAGMFNESKPGDGADFASAAAALERAAGRIKEQLKTIPGFRNLEQQIEVKVTAEGLRIELQEGGQDTFFDSGSARVKGQTEEVLRVVARELAQLPQSIAIEGHTDAAPFGSNRAYTNWELSTDRANAARRIMQDAGLPAAHVKAIRGFADTILRTPSDPFNPGNRRVSIVVQNETVAKAARAASRKGSEREHARAASATPPMAETRADDGAVPAPEVAHARPAGR